MDTPNDVAKAIKAEKGKIQGEEEIHAELNTLGQLLYDKVGIFLI